MENRIKKKGLGRGLSTLLAETNISNNPDDLIRSPVDLYLPIEKVVPNSDQPRKLFDKLKLDELALSVAKNGIIQPVIVRIKNEKYELIAGERRWRAAQLAKLHLIPAVVRNVTDKQAAEYAIAENIQREDLTAVEEAKSYKKLIEIYSYTQAEVSLALGKSRSYIANMLRLLTLPTEILNLLETTKISIGHARALIGLDDAVKIAKKIIDSKLSVRETESLVKRSRLTGSVSTTKTRKFNKKDIDTLNLEKALTFQTKFKITIDQHCNNNGGRLIFNYGTLDELDRICEFLHKK